LYFWYGQVCVAVLFVSQVVLAMLRTSVGVHLMAAAAFVPLLVVGRWTGLFVSLRELQLRLGGFARWRVPIDDVTAVTVGPAGWGVLKGRLRRLEVHAGSRVLRLPPDVLGYLFSTDQDGSLTSTTARLRRELELAGAVALAA
jgi:hypothetical protein